MALYNRKSREIGKTNWRNHIMPTRQSHSILFISLRILITLSIVMMTTIAYASIAYQFSPIPPKPDPYPIPQPTGSHLQLSSSSLLTLGKGSDETGDLMFRSISKLFMAFASLELGNYQKAEEFMEKVRFDMKKANAFYEDYASNISNRPISIATLTDDESRAIKKDFEFYGLKLPENYKELTSITYNEVRSFSEFLNKVRFGNNLEENRKTARDIVDRLTRYMLLGISVSGITAPDMEHRN